jgi:hypothetical protein
MYAPPPPPRGTQTEEGGQSVSELQANYTRAKGSVQSNLFRGHCGCNLPSPFQPYVETMQHKGFRPLSTDRKFFFSLKMWFFYGIVFKEKRPFFILKFLLFIFII